MVRLSFPSSLSMACRDRAPIFAVVRPSCELGDPVTSAVQPSTVEVGKNFVGGGCFTGGVVYVVTGSRPVANRGLFDGGGLFTSNVTIGVVIDRSLHGGGRRGSILVDAVIGGERPGGRQTS